MHPDWLGNPQHVVGGLGLAVIAGLVAIRLGVRRPLLVAVVAIGVAMTGEAVIEIAEYALLYDIPPASAYVDTIADLASTLVGAVLGGLAIAVLAQRAAGPAIDTSCDGSDPETVARL